MQRLSFRLLLLALAGLLVASVSVRAQEHRKVDWDKYGDRLVEALKSTHEGLQLSAMQQTIRYGDSVDVVLARYVIMDKFMNNPNRKVRLLALRTLAQVDNPLDMGLLELQLKWEEDPLVKRQIAQVLLENGRMKKTEFNAKYSGLDIKQTQEK